MAKTKESARGDAEDGPTLDLVRAEAETRAHDRVTPEAMLDAIAAVNRYVEAFVAGAEFAAARHEASR